MGVKRFGERRVCRLIGLARSSARYRLVADEPDALWCLDLLEAKTLPHQKLRILCVSDAFTREVLAIEVDVRFVSE